MAACDHVGCPVDYCDHKQCTPDCRVCAVPVGRASSEFWHERPHPPSTPCSHCGAGVGEPCQSVGRHRRTLSQPHPSRLEAA